MSESGDRPPRPSERTYRSLAAVSVTRLTGIGPKLSAALGEVGISDVLDVITTYPHRYIDRTARRTIAQLGDGEEATLEVRVRSISSRRTKRGQSMVELRVEDESASAPMVFFNQPWWGRILAPGSELLVFARARTYRDRLQLDPKAVDVVGRPGATRRTGAVLPVYPASPTNAITSDLIARMVSESLERAGPTADPVPAELLARLGLESRDAALRAIHRPVELGEVEPARRRLAFDELLRLQVALFARRAVALEGARGIVHDVSPRDLSESTERASLCGHFINSLPYVLTGAQRRALEAIFADMAAPSPMHRLLQGDVGSGKTVVAVATLLAAVQSGHQGAFMVPTEVLAEQHGAAVSSLTAGLIVADDSVLGGTRPFRLASLTSKMPASERRLIEEGLCDGSIDVVVGTHALLSEGVVFASLGAIVIDEQHRFGVDQRASLRAKGGGHDPDVLVMTATPIPRTAAMVLFGDLDQVVLDELPPGRTPIVTTWAKTVPRERQAWASVRDEVAKGRRAYVVCPLVDESERVVATAASAEYERLRDGELAGLSLGLLHGQLRADERESVMAAFRSGEVQVLVATTVIEVGVDVPEATVIVIEDADRFGIAQLHQLRGRVGRGAYPSSCFLLSRSRSESAAARLEALESSTDGFYLAEVDLTLRGQGTILSTRQKGRSDLALADIDADADLLDAARGLASRLASTPRLEAVQRSLVEEVSLFLGEEEAAFLFKS